MSPLTAPSSIRWNFVKREVKHATSGTSLNLSARQKRLSDISHTHLGQRQRPRQSPAHHPPNTDRHILLRFSSNDVVERPLLERPVGHIHHATPLREAPLRDEVPFYAPVEHPSSQHRLLRKSAAHLTEPKSALGVPVSGHLQRKCPKNALGVLQTGHLQHPAGRRPATSDSARA